MPYLVYSLIILIILLLNTIRTKQKQKIKQLPRIKLVYITTKIITSILLCNIYIRKYIHILILLELVVSKKFYYILTNSTFRVYIGLVVVNKVYLITNQSTSFYRVYILLYKLQILLSQKLQFIYIAILDNITLVNIQRLVEFNTNIYIIYTIVD